MVPNRVLNDQNSEFQLKFFKNNLNPNYQIFGIKNSLHGLSYSKTKKKMIKIPILKKNNTESLNKIYSQ